MLKCRPAHPKYARSDHPKAIATTHRMDDLDSRVAAALASTKSTINKAHSAVSKLAATVAKVSLRCVGLSWLFEALVGGSSASSFEVFDRWSDVNISCGLHTADQLAYSFFRWQELS